MPRRDSCKESSRYCTYAGLSASMQTTSALPSPQSSAAAFRPQDRRGCRRRRRAHCARCFCGAHRRMLGIDFERDQPSSRLQRAGKPRRAIAAECADLQQARRARQTNEEIKQLALRRRHIDRQAIRRPRTHAGFDRSRGSSASQLGIGRILRSVSSAALSPGSAPRASRHHSPRTRPPA